MTKKCSTCKRDKHVMFFNRSRANADGWCNQCRACSIEGGKKSKLKRAQMDRFQPAAPGAGA